MKRLLVSLLATAHAHAALSFNVSNTTGLQTFAATHPAADWSTVSLAGASGNLTSDAAVDAAAQALTAAGINTVLGTQAGYAINAIAQRDSTANFIYTAPTGNNATALMATLQNDSGAAVSAINIACNHTRIGTATEESMGHRVFYSLTGLANSWTLIPGLSGISANQALSVTVSLSAPWANTAKLYLLWVDDNGSGADTPFTIDDFVVTLGNPLPVVTLAAPANGGTASAPASFPLTATATDDGSVAQVEFLRNGGVIHTDNTPPYEYTDSGLAAGNYSYAARATDNLGATATSPAANVSVFTDASQTALQFDGVNDYVTMGAATSTLGATAFTVECWFKRTGAGTGNATTGTNGLAAAIPLVTKGRSEADNSNLDCNYFLGIDNATGRLCAGFEATLSTPLNGTGAANNNYPVFGTTVIPQNVWTHAAMTWDGNAWKLFVNGVEETITVPNLLPTPRPVPRADSIRHFAIASALDSTGVATGFFQGAIDEVRVWNVARTAAEVSAMMNTPITGTVPGLLARYGLNEGTGITAASSIGAIPGILTNGPLWTDGVVMTPNAPPVVSLTAPPGLATNLGTSGTVTLSANVSDPENQPMTVTFYGRPKLPPVGPDFTLVTLPDTQFYSQNTGGNRLSQFIAQTNWIVSSKDSLNTVFVAHMGDMVQNGDAIEQEWINADRAMDIIENPATTLLAHGIPWGGAPGNHDFTPMSNPAGTSIFWNQYFGVARWAGRPYFQGNYGANNNNNYQFFSASGLDFIVINLAYNPNTAGTQAIMDWADALLKAHPARRAIITSHWFIGTGNPASWGGHGQAVYDNLKDNPNLFMMLCGHIHGEGRRQDVFEGRTVHTLLQDYQDRAGAAGGFGGGDGWLRYYTFSPASNEIHAKTCRATSGEYETDADSQFSISYNMGAGTAPWTPLGTVSSNGGSVTLDWTGLAGSTEYEWYAAVSDGANSIGGTVRRFTTASNASPTVSLTSPAAAATVAKPAQVAFAATAADTDGSVGKVEFFAGAEKVGVDLADPYAFNWTAISGSYALTAVATDNQGARTTSTAVNITVTNPSNMAPSVSIDTPAAGASVPCGNVALAASASDTDGVVSKVEFFHGAVKIGEDATAPFTFNWQAVAAGSYAITAVATDNDGGSGTSAPVAFSVTPVTDLSFQEGSGG
jgi:Concanavalin A-like lectin/glucanases superfamily/Bacterial Ig domain/Calcineurin-like phosphoesterase